jgi:hypothetical protein
MDKGHGKPITLPSYWQLHGVRLIRRRTEKGGEIDLARQGVAKAIETASNDVGLTRDIGVTHPRRKKLVVVRRRDNSAILVASGRRVVNESGTPEAWGGGHCALL